MTVVDGTSLNAARRAQDLAELALARKPVDLLVIGGGVTGAGVALDAASRGLSVVLVEKHDLAFGTSRWSSKLVHGGLRYLASGAVGIARESAVERGIMIEHTAPHLVRPFRQVMPLLPALKGKSAGIVRAGFVAGDLLRASAGTSSKTLPRSRRINADETLALAPTVRSDRLRGGLLNWDGQLEDDARLVVAIARTAAGHGARILTRCSAHDVTGAGAVLHDELTGSRLNLDARMVINATGVWAADIDPQISLRPSRGTHLVLSPKSFSEGGVSLTAGLTVPVPGSSSRFVFALPSPEGFVYLGITDEDAPGEIPDVPVASEQEIDFLLETINSAITAPLSRKDIIGSYSGLRPLLNVDQASGGTADISRKHAVLTSADGLTTIVGGKLTTYRRMAEDAVDHALAGLTERGAPPIETAQCRTKRLPLVGAAPRSQLALIDAPQRLINRYGTEAQAVLSAASGDATLLQPVSDGVEATCAELIFGVLHEGALDEADLLDRRTRVGFNAEAREAAMPAARAALQNPDQ